MSLLRAIRRRLARIRHGLDGKLHTRRRVLARERLESLAPRTVLFVCLGNICRSPYAERVLAQEAGPVLEVDSAGFIGPGRPPPDEALAAARAVGIEHGDHRSKTVTRDLLERADVIFVFDRKNARRLRATPGARAERILWLGDFDPEWAGKRAIPDPWGRPPEEFEATFARIRRCVGAVLESL